MSMINLEIDGRPVRAEEGESVLQAARRSGVEIPTLCYHEGLDAWGGCRLCMVEITHADWGGWKGLVTGCLYPVEEGLIVDTGVGTGNEAVLDARKNVLDLLLARCPTSEVIREMAAEYGVVKTSFVPTDTDSTCIMCTLCIRACEAVGASAISTVGRGADKRIAPPFDLPAETCVGCFSCVRVCPTDAIDFTDGGDVREIWGRSFEMVKCEETGEPIMTAAHRDFLVAKTGLPADYFTAGPRAKKRKTADGIRATFQR